MTTGEELARELTRHERYDVDALEGERFDDLSPEVARRRAELELVPTRYAS